MLYLLSFNTIYFLLLLVLHVLVPLGVLVHLLLGPKLHVALLQPTGEGLGVDLLVMPDEVSLVRGGEVTLVTSVEQWRDRGTVFGVVAI